jgi:hypothetical protein
MPIRLLVVAIPIAIAVSARLFAQASAGLITGTVTDVSGAAGASISAVNQATQERRSAAANSSGVYVLAQLPVGDYDVAVSRDGFKRSVKTGVRVDANLSVTVDVQLEVGSVTENITVAASAAAVETEGAAFHVLNLTGDARDEVVLWDTERVWIYTQDRPFAGTRIYDPIRNPEYNESNYRTTVSLPRWK